jgi:hypothetical protein
MSDDAAKSEMTTLRNLGAKIGIAGLTTPDFDLVYANARHLIAASTKSLVRVIQKCASPVCSRRQSWRGYCRGRTARATVTPRSITDHRRLCKTLLERNVRHGHLVAIRVKLHEGMF